MEGRRLLLLCFGLFMLMSYVNCTVKIYGSNSYNPYEDVGRRIEALKSEKLRLENQLSVTTRPLQKMHLQKEVQRVRLLLQEREATARVSYKDYAELRDKMREQCERDKEGMRQQFEMEKQLYERQVKRKEEMRVQAVSEKVEIQKKTQKDIDTIKERNQLLTKEADRIAKEYAETTEKQIEEKEKITKEKKKILMEKEDLAKKLEKTQKRHSWALEATAVTSKSDNKTVLVPYQDEINEIRHRVNVLSKMDIRDELLPIAKENLEDLLHKLYEESGMSESTPPQDLERLFDGVEDNTVALREVAKQKTQLETRMKVSKASLDKTKQAVDAAQEFLEHVAHRKAYLKAIMQVNELIKKCS